jgi:hypothetical protein
MAFGYDALSYVVYRTGIALYPAHLRSSPNAETSSVILRFPGCDQFDLYVARAGSQDCLQEDLQRVAVSRSSFLLSLSFLLLPFPIHFHLFCWLFHVSLILLLFPNIFYQFLFSLSFLLSCPISLKLYYPSSTIIVPPSLAIYPLNYIIVIDCCAGAVSPLNTGIDD